MNSQLLNINVFLVEDNPIYLEALENYLHRNTENIKIHSFSTGEDMLKQLDKKPDIIVLDYMLHDSIPKARNGMAILRKVIFRKPSTPVIVLSGQKDKNVSSKLIEEGAYDYVTKFENGFSRVAEHVRNIRLSLQEEREKEIFVAKATAWGFVIIACLCTGAYLIHKHF